MKYFDQLNPQQKAATQHKDGPVLVIAGAGTGKTRVITERIAHLIDELKVKPEKILALTFTEKAAEEMEVRVSDTRENYTFDVNITTFNAFGNNLINRFCYDIGLSKNIRLLSDIQQIIFIKEYLDKFQLKYYAPITNPEGMLGELVRYFAKLKNDLIDPKVYQKYADGILKKADDPGSIMEARRHQELSRAYRVYLDLMRERNSIDLSDQLYLAVELLETRPNVLRKIQSEIEYILVDEFQDTNLSQSRLLDLLAGSKQNIMVVGDDDQSIYRFRGAAISNILAFNERYPSAKQLALTQNYRSSQEILDAAYRLIQFNNPQRLEAKYNIDKHLIGQLKGTPPAFETFETIEDEAHWIAEDIKQRVIAGQDLSEVAILLRKNSQSRVLKKYLDTAGIRFTVIGESEDLYRQSEIKILLNFLKTVANPRDSNALYHLLVSEVFSFDPTFIREVAATAGNRHQSLESLLRHNAKSMGQAFLDEFLTQLDTWRQQLPKLSVGQLCYKFLEDTNFLHGLLREAKDNPGVDERIHHLNHFFTTLLEFERVASDVSAVGYVDALPALMGAGEFFTPDRLDSLSSVNILTVHKAKGLEFETVYLFDVSQWTFPARRQSNLLEPPEDLISEEEGETGLNHMQEERRLMYVAMTRAKKDLIFTFSRNHGGRQAKKPSQFIEEAFGVRPEVGSSRQPKNVSTRQIELFKTVSESKSLHLPMVRDGKVHLSPRMVEDYLLCPAEFKLRHILKPPTPLQFALEYGSLMHQIIQTYNKAKAARDEITLDGLVEQLEAGWPEEGFVSLGIKERSLREAKASIKRFYRREERQKKYPIQVERAFKSDLPELKVVLSGRFDAVYKDVVTEIRDYKTGKANVTDQEKADRQTKNSLQLGIYAYAWWQLYGEIPMVSLDFIDAGFYSITSKTTRQLQTVERKIKQVADGILSHDFKPGSSHQFCSHQEYGF